MYETSKDLDLNLANFLMAYRNTPHSLTNQPPSVMMYGRTLRSKLHRLRPSDQMETERLNVDNEQKVVDSRKNERTFGGNQKIWVRTDNHKEYEPAVVEKRHGESLWYDVNYKGRTIKKHAETMKKRLVPVIKLQKQKMTGPEEICEWKNIEQLEITKIPQASAGSSRESESVVSCNPPNTTAQMFGKVRS